MSCIFVYVSSSARDGLLELLWCSKKAERSLKQHLHVTECALGK